MVENLVNALVPLMEKSGGSVIIEAGHFYLDTGIDDQALAGAAAAANLVQLTMSFFNIQPEQMLLIDDINTSFEPFMVQAVVSGFIQYGFNPQHLIYESDLVSQGKINLKILQEKGLTKEHHGRLRLKQGWISLQGKAGISDHPACEVMDAVLYQQKLSQWSGAITILPHGYQEQQQKTRKVFQAITGIQKPNIQVLYHNRNSEIIESDYWG